MLLVRGALPIVRAPRTGRGGAVCAARRCRVPAPALALFATLALGGATSARAQEPTPDGVALVVAACPDAALDPDVLAARLRVELSSDGVRGVRVVETASIDDVEALAIVRVASSPCSAESVAFEVRIDDLVTRKHVERTIDLAEVAVSARPRALAIAIAELLRASWAELALAEAPPGAPAEIVQAIRVRAAGLRDAHALADPIAPPPSPPAPGPPTTREPRIAIAAAFVARTFPGARASPLGGRLSLDLVPIPELVIRIDAEVALGTSLDPLGAIDLGYATLGLTAALTVALGDLVLASIGPRIAAGAAWASGRPYDPSTISASGVGPTLLLGGAIELDVRLAGPLALRFGISADGAAIGYQARVSGIPVAGIAGGGVAAWAGVAIEP
jgi:hypothetical protein